VWVYDKSNDDIWLMNTIVSSPFSVKLNEKSFDF